MTKTEKDAKIINDYIKSSNCNVSLGTLIDHLIDNYDYTATEAKACCSEYFKNSQVGSYKDPVSIFQNHSE